MGLGADDAVVGDVNRWLSDRMFSVANADRDPVEHSNDISDAVAFTDSKYYTVEISFGDSFRKCLALAICDPDRNRFVIAEPSADKHSVGHTSF